MDNSYDELKSIYDEWQRTCIEPPIDVFIGLLKKYEYNLRDKDGTLHHVTVSVPKSRKKALVLGIRYQKKDTTWTEDHFLFEKGKSIQPYYKGKIEKVLSEYKGAHKKQSGFY